MINRTLSLALGVATFVGVASSAMGQTTFNIPTAHFSSYIGNQIYNGTNPTGGGPSGGANTIATATNGSSIVLGTGVTVNTALITAVFSGTYGVEASIRLENDGFPGQYTHFNFADTAAFTSFNVNNVFRSFGGSTNGLAYPWDSPATLPAGTVIGAGSIWTAESYDFWDDDTAGDDALGTNVSFTIAGLPPAPPALATINAGNVDFGGDLGVDTTNTILTGQSPLAVAGYIGDGVYINSGTTITSVDPASWASEPSVYFENSAFPGIGYTFSFSDTAGTYASFAVVGPRPMNLKGGLHTIMPVGSYWDIECFETFDDSGPGSVDSQGTNLSFNINSYPNVVVGQTLVAPGSLNAVDAYANALNGTFSVVANPMTLANMVTYTGDFNPVVAGTLGDDVPVIIESSAYPSAFAYFWPYAGVLSVATSLSNTDFGLFGSLVGAAIPGSSTLRVEIADQVDDGGAGVTEATLDNVSFTLYSTDAATNQTLSGDLELSDTSISFASNRSISYQVKQGATVLSSGTITASSKNTSLGINVPASASGSAKLVLNGSTFLQRVVTLNLTGSNQSLGSVVMANGDADDDGEVGLNDIDLIITNYGLDTASADLDIDGEVGLNDIDIAIAHYGEGDESE